METIAIAYANISATLKAIEEIRERVIARALDEGLAEKIVESYSVKTYADSDMVEVSTPSVRVTLPKGTAPVLFPIPEGVEAFETGLAYDNLTIIKGAYERMKGAFAEELKKGESFATERVKVTVATRTTRKPKDGAEPTATETREREMTLVHTARADRIRREHSGKPEA